MIPYRLNKTLRTLTWMFAVSVVALLTGVFLLLVPIEVLQLTWAKGFELFYFRLFGVTASMTLPTVVVHFILWDLGKIKENTNA